MTITDQSKFKAFADRLNSTQKLIGVLGVLENIVQKGDNAGYQHCLLFPQCFLKPFSTRLLKSGTVWLKVKYILARIGVMAALESTTLCTSVSSTQDLRTEECWFDPPACPIFFQRKDVSHC